METRNLKILTWIVIPMVVIDALYAPLMFGGARLFPALFATLVAPNANGVDGIAMLFKFATIIVFSVWIYRAGRNLIGYGYHDLEFTPGARIWWFAVPIANLFIPYHGMRELWNASHGRRNYTENEPIVAIWWGFWLLHGFAGLIARFLFPAEGTIGLWVQGTINLGLALVAIQMLREIAAAQARLRGPELAQVFA